MVSEVCKIGIHSLGSVCTCPSKSNGSRYAVLVIRSVKKALNENVHKLNLFIEVFLIVNDNIFPLVLGMLLSKL